MIHNYRSTEDYKNSSSYNGEPLSEDKTETVVFVDKEDKEDETIAAQKEKRLIRQRERRANLSEEQRVITKAKAAEMQRKRRAEIKASDPTKYEEYLRKQREYNSKSIEQRCAKERDDYRYQSSFVDISAGSHNRKNKIQEAKSSSTPETYLARKRDYKNRRYAEMKNAEIQLRNGSAMENENINIEELQNLANKRRKLIDAAIEYRRKNRRSKWVPIAQVWDEDHPCQ